MEVPSTNVFDLSHSNKLSFNMGDLVPVLNQEVYPGDKIQISLMHLLKMSPLVTPVMHRCKVDFHAFFVPNRLLWENFEKFQAYDTLNEIPVHPYIDAGNIDCNPDLKIESGSLMDYLGVPTTSTNLSTFNIAHPLRNLNALIPAAYLKIYDDYYRDQNLMAEEFPQPMSDGNQSSSSWTSIFGESMFSKGSLLKRAWEKDYFTSCLPFAQKGQEVVLPLGESAPIEFIDPDTLGVGAGAAATKLRNQNGSVS